MKKVLIISAILCSGLGSVTSDFYINELREYHDVDINYGCWRFKLDEQLNVIDIKPCIYH